MLHKKKHLMTLRSVATFLLFPCAAWQVWITDIPNYHLQACQDSVPSLQHVQPLTLRRSLRSMAMNLWDERQQKLVSFRALKGMPRRRAWRTTSPAR